MWECHTLPDPPAVNSTPTSTLHAGRAATYALLPPTGHSPPAPALGQSSAAARAAWGRSLPRGSHEGGGCRLWLLWVGPLPNKEGG